MMKKINLNLLFLTSIFTLLPILVGLILWKDLPASLPSHFGLDGQADGFSSKLEVVFLIPLVTLGLHLFAVIVTSLDPKASHVSPKMKTLIYWLVPFISGLVQLSIYGAALGLIGNSTRIGLVMVGIVFLVVGNYLPKTSKTIQSVSACPGPWTVRKIGIRPTVWRVDFGFWVASSSSLIAFFPGLFSMFSLLSCWAWS